MGAGKESYRAIDIVVSPRFRDRTGFHNRVNDERRTRVGYWLAQLIGTAMDDVDEGLTAEHLDGLTCQLVRD